MIVHIVLFKIRSSPDESGIMKANRAGRTVPHYERGEIVLGMPGSCKFIILQRPLNRLSKRSERKAYQQYFDSVGYKLPSLQRFVYRWHKLRRLE
jgi:hypothetical protein